MDPTGEHVASDIKLPARRTWRIEALATDADGQPHPVGAQSSMLESECTEFAKEGTDPDDLIRDAVLSILDLTLKRNGWTMLSWAWHTTEL